MKNLWTCLGVVLTILVLPGSLSAAENRHFVGFGIDAAIVDSDVFFNEEDHIGFSIFGKYGFNDRWGLFVFYRDMEDDESLFSLIGLEQTYTQIGVRGVRMWRPDKKLRPHVGFGAVQTDFDANFFGMSAMSDDGIGLSVSGGLEAGSQKFAFYGEYGITVVDLDTLDPFGETTIGNFTAGFIFKF